MMKNLLTWQGITRQAVHQALARDNQRQQDISCTLALADQVRKDHPSMGCRDIYYVKAAEMPRGRDWCEQVLLHNGYRIKPPARSFTKAGTDVCENLIEGMQITAPNQVWQTDITYVWAHKRWYFVSFILDVFTRKIISMHCSKDLSTLSQIICLKKALRKVKEEDRKNLIIHTDRGVQYTSKEFKKIFVRCMSQSMARYAWQNSYCERVHRTIKGNYLTYYTLDSYEALVKGVRKAVRLYNSSKPHRGLPGRLSPDQFYKAWKVGQHPDYSVKVWSPLKSIKMLNLN